MSLRRASGLPASPLFPALSDHRLLYNATRRFETTSPAQMYIGQTGEPRRIGCTDRNAVFFWGGGDSCGSKEPRIRWSQDRVNHSPLGWPPGAWAVGRPTLHGEPVRLRPVRATPCFVISCDFHLSVHTIGSLAWGAVAWAGPSPDPLTRHYCDEPWRRQ